MQSIASFNAVKFGKSYIVSASNIRRDGKDVPFQFDTGASMSIIGLNTICNSSDQANVLKDIIMKHIERRHIENQSGKAKTVTNEPIIAYPCVCKGVSIADTNEIDFYFHFYLGNVNWPLLGVDYIDDCACHHSIGGDFLVTAVAENVGRRFFPDKVLDFNEILDEYYSVIK